MVAVNFCMPLLKYFTQTFRRTADAALDLVAVSLEPSFKGKRGYFVGQKAVASSDMSRDSGVQARLWAACWRWSGLAPEETVLSNATPLEA
jgi:hypothetical protein